MSYWDRRSNVSNAKITKTALITTVSQVIVPANPSRVGCLIWNPTANSVYIAYGPVCDGNKQTAIILTNTTWAMPNPTYTGIISCIRNSGSGSIFVTELIN